MLDHLTAHWPPAIKNRSARTRRRMIGAAVVTPQLLIGLLSGVHPGPPADSGLAIQLRHARYTDGYQTVWFYQRLSATCAKHRQPPTART